MTEENNAELAGVRLTANITVEKGNLTVTYRLANSGKSTIYVFDRLWEFGPDGNYVEPASNSYVLLRDDGTLNLVRGIAALPRTRRVEMRFIPFATKVEAGDELTGTIELHEPVEEYNPYFSKLADSKTEAAKSSQILLTMNYVESSEALEVKEAPLSGSFNVWSPTLLQDVREVTVGPRASEIKVARRTDSFERF
ncbi:MAG TPA: hypothetical protein PKA82_17140 [Pyrinomonadaceae bacterium]|nr:hypothetical protein [Pyrinomonadaceae bacterium]